MHSAGILVALFLVLRAILVLDLLIAWILCTNNRKIKLVIVYNKRTAAAVAAWIMNKYVEKRDYLLEKSRCFGNILKE